MNLPLKSLLTNKKYLALGGGVLAVAVAVIVVAVWYFAIRSDAPPPVSLEEAATAATEGSSPYEAGSPSEPQVAVEPAAATEPPPTPEPQTPAESQAVSESQADAYSPYPEADTPSPTDSGAQAEDDGGRAGEGDTTSEDDAADDTPVQEPSEPQGLVGTWTVIADERSFAGYRVQEELGGIGTTTAVGRTSDINGSLTFDGAAITAVEIEVDLTTLRSDDSRRDRSLRRQGIEWGTFPTASFVLAEPIDIGTVPEEGEPRAFIATGAFTLHGVTQEVNIDLEGQLIGDVVAVVGSLDIQFADYDITPPSSFIVVSIEDHGVMEFQMLFERAF